MEVDIVTSYSTIYTTFLQKIHDIDMANNLNVNAQFATDSMFGYMKSGIVNFNVCVQDLTDRVAPQNNSCVFSGDGITTSFILTNTPVDGSNYTVTVNSIETNSYVYDSIANTITFTVAPVFGENNINLAWSFLGQFNIDLTDLEQEILAMYMVYQWVSPFINDTLEFKNYLQSGDFKTWSGAQFITAKIGLQKYLKDMSDELMFKYSYDQTDYTNFN
jgi:hypothetical protein